MQVKRSSVGGGWNQTFTELQAGCDRPDEALLPAVAMDTLPGPGCGATEKTAEGERERQTEKETPGESRERTGWRKRRVRKKRKKKQQLDSSELKRELIPSALFNTAIVLLALQLAPSGCSFQQRIKTFIDLLTMFCRFNSIKHR